jgi:hypothetical protein
MTDKSLITVFAGSILFLFLFLFLSLSYVGFSVAYGQGMNTTSGLMVNNTAKGNQSQPVHFFDLAQK